MHEHTGQPCSVPSFAFPSPSDSFNFSFRDSGLLAAVADDSAVAAVAANTAGDVM
jgi:hypothetical protein